MDGGRFPQVERCRTTFCFFETARQTGAGILSTHVTDGCLRAMRAIAKTCHRPPKSVRGQGTALTMSALAKKETKDDEDVPDMKLGDITEGLNERGIPAAKFIEDIEAFTQSFTPPASSELLIGAYSDLLAKYRAIEANLGSKRKCADGS